MLAKSRQEKGKLIYEAGKVHKITEAATITAEIELEIQRELEQE